MPKFELMPESKETRKQKNPFRRLAEHPLGKAVIVSGALHAAVLEGQKTKNWFRPNLVLHPQSDAEQDRVRSIMNAREKKVDRKALESYRKETAERIEHGEKPTLKRMYFDLERLNGVPAEQVASAEQKADELIEKFSDEVGDGLDEDEVRNIVKKLYGPDSNYEYGQASVTEYFLTEKRNCVAIDRAEQIIFEGVLAHLNEREQAKFALGEEHVKQHVIATLTERTRSGVERMFLLEPNVTVTSTEPEAGTARVDAGFLKKAMVSDTILAVKAVGGDVKPSPDLDVDLRSVKKPTPEALQQLLDYQKGSYFVKTRFSDISDWSQEAKSKLVEYLRSNQGAFSLDENGRLPQAAYDILEEVSKHPRAHSDGTMLEIEPQEGRTDVDPETFKRLFTSEALKTGSLRLSHVKVNTAQEVDAILKSSIPFIILDDLDVSRADLLRFKNVKSFYVQITPKNYLTLLKKIPELAEVTKILYVSGFTDEDSEIAKEIEKIKSGLPGHPTEKI